jgi:copper chaperone CopZ
MNIAISGMHCQGCVQRVKKALASVEGVTVDRVEIGRAVVYAQGAALDAVLEAIRKAGYEPYAPA